jgi:hypothetical protein
MRATGTGTSAAARTLIGALAIALSLGGCATGARPGGVTVPPNTGAPPGGPPPLPEVSAPAPPSLVPVAPVPGTRERSVRWTLAGSADGGGTLLLDVAVGGPPCDAVTAVDVMESAERVTVSVYAGATATASCAAGVRALVGTFRVPAHLSRPLGSRTLVDGAAG